MIRSTAQLLIAVTATASLAICLTPAASEAQDPARDPMRDTGAGPSRAFGNVGQMAFSSDVALTIQHSSQDATTIQFAPAADYFVAHNFSIGAAIAIDYINAAHSDSTRFSIGPRIGYNVPFTDTVGIWPKLGFSYSHDSVSTDLPNNDSSVTLTQSRTGDHVTLNLFVPIMFHPAEHFFVGFGPFLDSDLSGKNKTTFYGARLTLGGWVTL